MYSHFDRLFYLLCFQVRKKSDIALCLDRRRRRNFAGIPPASLSQGFFLHLATYLVRHGGIGVILLDWQRRQFTFFELSRIVGKRERRDATKKQQQRRDISRTGGFLRPLLHLIFFPLPFPQTAQRTNSNVFFDKWKDQKKKIIHIKKENFVGCLTRDNTSSLSQIEKTFFAKPQAADDFFLPFFPGKWRKEGRNLFLLCPPPPLPPSLCP